jgi:hypothetical protein
VKAGVSKEDAEGAANMGALQALIDGASSTESTTDAPTSSGDNVADNPDITAGGNPQEYPLTPAPTEDELENKGGGPIVRMTMLAWWCPNCDHSNERSLNACAKCGAEVSKDGKSVGKAKRI